jgi:hypothetical protein
MNWADDILNSYTPHIAKEVEAGEVAGVGRAATTQIAAMGPTSHPSLFALTLEAFAGTVLIHPMQQDLQDQETIGIVDDLLKVVPDQVLGCTTEPGWHLNQHPVQAPSGIQDIRRDPGKLHEYL